ncbi:MAG: FliA/WhiG family RNA polymerase sigma factor [Firmicutes bacterium]|nr:FliA/WhiG family RNA polymerase sigma factor [Bacillota bacterium]MDH7495378.1 FliA/WhiG family RNA polymerase sigma factor [Bacillota bacterium]
MATEELWNQYKFAGDPEAKHGLISHYLPMVPILAGRMAMKLSAVVGYEDLVGWGVIGLIEAVEKFDPGRGVKFETYATTRIKGAMADGMREADWVPRSVRQNARRIARVYASLEKELGRAATDEEVAAEMGVSLEEFQRMVADASRGAVLSLDEMIQMSENGRHVTLLDAVPDMETPDPLAVCEVEDLKERLARAIDELPERERLVVTLHYYDELTVKEIAEILGVSEGRVSQLHTRAVLRLRSRLAPGEASDTKVAGGTRRAHG